MTFRSEVRARLLNQEVTPLDLMLMSTSPLRKMNSRMLSWVTSWKLAFFSLAKKRSGFHRHWNMLGSTVSASLLKSVGRRSRGSFHRWRKKMFTL